MFGLRRKNSPRKAQTQQLPAKPVFSYYSNRSRTEESVGRNKAMFNSNRVKKRSWWHHLPTYIAGIALIVCLLYSLGLDTSNPKVVQPSDDKAALLRDKGTYEQAVRKHLKSSIFNSNKITVNISGITRDMQAEFPELADITITLPFVGRRPVVYVEPSPPTVLLSSKNGLFVLDNRGRAIISATQLKNLSSFNLPTVSDQSGLSVSLGKGVLPANDVAFITTVIEQLKAKNITVESITLPTQADQLDVRIAGKPYVIKMNLQNDARQQIGRFIVAKAKLEAESQEPKEYFDVRVEERVYYK